MTSSIIDVLPADVLHIICDELSGLRGPPRENLGPLASTCKYVQTIALPFLLRTVTIRDGNAAGMQLQEMLASQAIRKHVRRFNFVPRASETALILAWCPTLIQLLLSMNQLQEFRFNPQIDPDDREEHANIQNLFLHPDRTPRFQLRSVRRLATDECAAFLLAICPEVSHMALKMISRRPYDNTSLCGEWPVAPGVQYLQLDANDVGNHWEAMFGQTADVRNLITTSMPNVKTFVFDGFYNAPRVLPHFSLFTQVEILVLPDLDYLGLGFNPPRCGNVYRGARGKEVQRMVDLSHKEACAKLKTLALDLFPRLRKLWTGTDEMCDFTRFRRRKEELVNLAFERVDFIPEWEM